MDPYLQLSSSRGAKNQLVSNNLIVAQGGHCQSEGQERRVRRDVRVPGAGSHGDPQGAGADARVGRRDVSRVRICQDLARRQAHLSRRALLGQRPRLMKILTFLMNCNDNELRS